MMESKMLTWLRMYKKELLHSIRTAVAAVGSLMIARFCRLPESYWAAVTAIVIMQSTLGAAWTVSKQRFAGTALGAATGALLTAYAAQNVAAFGAGVFVLGLICGLLRIGRNAFRYAGITLANCHARNACRTCVDDRHPSVPRNFRGNRSRIAPDRRLAGA
jgi:uncharacterized membrane protein YccC